MRAPPRIFPVRLATGLIALFAASVGLSAQPPKAPLPREISKPALPLIQKLPDGTYSFAEPNPVDGERILLTPQEHQKLLDQIEQLKKQLAVRKAVSPSGCAIRVKVENRGDSTVAALKLSYSFRTATPGAAVSLGAKRGFLVAASLDGNKLPALEATEDGFAVFVESIGDHTAVFDLECPVLNRGNKPEIGFEIGLPRAAITTLIFEPPANVPRVSLVTRSMDTATKSVDPRRISGLDVKSLAPPQPNRDPYPLGPIDSLEILWEPLAAATASEVVQTAEVDLVCLLSESFVETSAKFRLKGTARTWRFAAPADAAFTVERAAGSSLPPDATAGGLPVVSKPTDAAKAVWKVDLPLASSASDWIVSVVVRTPRPKNGEPTFKGPFSIGPLAALDVARQSGSVKVTAPPNTRLAVKHGPELRPEPGPVAGDGESAAYFKFSSVPASGPFFSFEAYPLSGKLAIRPVYKIALTDAGWSVRAELRISPIRTAIDALTIELPQGWRGTEVSPPELIDSSQVLKSDGARQILVVRLAAEHKQPFDLVFTATVPTTSARELALLLPRFPNAVDRDASVIVSVPDGLEARCTGREWDGEQPAVWGQPLTILPGMDGKEPKVANAIGGKFERGVARLDLVWGAYRPLLTADVRAEIVVHDSQIVVTQRVALRSAEGLPRSVRFQSAIELKGLAPFDFVSPGVWTYSSTGEVKEANVKFEFAVPLPRPSADGSPRKVPIALVLPMGTTRSETLARVWVSSGAGRSVAIDLGAWRELAPEPSVDRDLLPALTLAGSGSDLPLMLEIREAPETGAAAVWVERGLLQASVGDEGTSFRARFLLRRWLSESVEIRLPDSLASVVPEVYLDEPPKRAHAILSTSASGVRSLRVSLPEAKPGRSIVLDLRYQLPNSAGEDGVVYAAPQPVAAFAGPVRWHVMGPAGTVPLAVGGGRAEQRWRTRFGVLVPVSASADELEKWLQVGNGEDLNSGPAEALVVRVNGAEPITVAHVSRLNLVIGCSVAALLLGLLASRLPSVALGPIVAAFAGVVAVGAVLYPQPASQLAAAAEPGLAALVLVLAFQTATRWYYRQRVTYLPGFARLRPEAAGTASTSGGSQPNRALPAASGSANAKLSPQPSTTGS